jgi:alkanesulfonate monooxygenase SsuD/methylene tetrahydromethanopterin reductase-like flavin-dependent oxidoreductase (luciferase family)
MTGLEPWAMGDRLARFKEFAAIVDLMLRQERTTWAGRFYTIQDAQVRPRPIQSPRPPMVIGGRSRAVLDTVAAVGAAWNTNGGRDHTPEEALADTRAKLAVLRKAWAKHQRDPQQMTLTFLTGQTRDAPLQSLGAFEDFVGGYRALGFSEFILFWLRDPDPDYALYDWIRDRPMLEKVALEWLPDVRKRLAP